MKKKKTLKLIKEKVDKKTYNELYFNFFKSVAKNYFFY